jgi:AraC-like DNA-binding protein
MVDANDAVQRMQDYIASHLLEEITLQDLAQASMYSAWHAHRLFVDALRMGPAEYIRKLRLSASALELRDSEVRILDVALKYGFSSVDGYQRAFLKEFGCNPGVYANSPMPIYLFIPFGVKLPAKKRINMETKTVFVQLLHKSERQAIIKRATKAEDYYQYCEEVDCEIWGLLASIKSINGEPYAYWLPQNLIKPGTSKYIQGVEVEPGYTTPLPEGLEMTTMPESDYLLFQGEPYDDCGYEEAIGELWRVIEKYDPSRMGLEWNPDAPKIQMEPIGSRGYMELHPVRPIH